MNYEKEDLNKILDAYFRRKKIVKAVKNALFWVVFFMLGIIMSGIVLISFLSMLPR